MLFETVDAIVNGPVDDAHRLAKVLENSWTLECLIDGEKVRFSGAVAKMLAQMLRATADGASVSVDTGAALLSPEEAARTLGVSRPTVVRWINEGLLSDHRVGAHHRVPTREVRELLRERRDRADAARMRVAGLGNASVEPTAAEVFAAALAARDGDHSALDRVRDDELAARAERAAAEARQQG